MLVIECPIIALCIAPYFAPMVGEKLGFVGPDGFIYAGVVLVAGDADNAPTGEVYRFRTDILQLHDFANFVNVHDFHWEVGRVGWVGWSMCWRSLWL